MRPPQLDEMVVIHHDGSLTMWRSVSTATPRPSPVGWFAGRLDREDMAALSEALQEVRHSGQTSRTVTPGSAVDAVEVDGAGLILGARDEADGGWSHLLSLIRTQLDDFTSSPTAAVALEVHDGTPTLVQMGDDSLQVDLSGLEVTATQWRHGESTGRWSAQPGDGEVTAGPGWQLALPADHGFTEDESRWVSWRVTFAAVRDGDRVPVGLHTPSRPRATLEQADDERAR